MLLSYNKYIKLKIILKIFLINLKLILLRKMIVNKILYKILIYPTFRLKIL